MLQNRERSSAMTSVFNSSILTVEFLYNLFEGLSMGNKNLQNSDLARCKEQGRNAVG